ncbi:MAG: hypothetical protein FWD06_05525 [Oscillospiraceae bacterium]|nr:hypothetical protein [Oscillospiraceae bacterium]
MLVKPRIFHSFWSKPLLQKRFGQPVAKQLESTLLFTTIGVIAAKRLGIEIVLHTDDFGAKLFQQVPYDQVYLTLNGHDIDAQFWASGKMIAMEHEPLGSCHLDLDAWVKGARCRDLVFGSTTDLVVQSVEDAFNVYDPNKKFVFDQGGVDISGHIDMRKARKSVEAYNCGLVRINNQQLKDKWLALYWKIVRELDRKKPPGLHERYCIPDLVAEQWALFQLCKQQGFRVQCICDGYNHHQKAKEIGYAHLISEHKYAIDDDLRQILQRLTAQQ